MVDVDVDDVFFKFLSVANVMSLSSGGAQFEGPAYPKAHAVCDPGASLPSTPHTPQPRAVSTLGPLHATPRPRTPRAPAAPLAKPL